MLSLVSGALNVSQFVRLLIPCFRVVLGTVVVIILECLPILSGLDELPGVARGLIVRDLPPVSLLPSLVFLLRIRPPCWVPSFPRL